MRFDIITIFPGIFARILEHGILRRAQAAGLVTVNLHDLRVFTHDRHNTVDDRPFGGGEGMVLKPEPLAEALAFLGVGPKQASGADIASVLRESSVEAEAAEVSPGSDPAAEAPAYQQAEAAGRPRVILLSAQGRTFSQAVARELAALDRVVLICGRYEGVDERVNLLFCDQELSIGDYVLSGGELAAAVVVDAVARLVPGVLGNEASHQFESFGAADAEIDADQEGVPRSQHGAGGLLDYPHYTRPAEFGGLRAPDVLLNGDHRQIRRWRREQQLRKTLANRPDLLEDATLSEDDVKMLEAIRQETGEGGQ
jgi:tRNA (guanine37-N1)-methyltransferase